MKKEKTKIIIKGLRCASKKNNRRNFRGVSLPSLAYVKFNRLVAEFMCPYSHLNFTTPLRVNVLYEIKGNYHQDLDNALSSIFDCLTDYHVIQDDDLIVELSAKKSNGHKDWNIEIEIEQL